MDKVICIKKGDWFKYEGDSDVFPLYNSIYTVLDRQTIHGLDLLQLAELSHGSNGLENWWQSNGFAPIEYIRTDLQNELVEQLQQELLNI